MASMRYDDDNKHLAAASSSDDLSHTGKLKRDSVFIDVGSAQALAWRRPSDTHRVLVVLLLAIGAPLQVSALFFSSADLVLAMFGIYIATTIVVMTAPYVMHELVFERRLDFSLALAAVVLSSLLIAATAGVGFHYWCVLLSLVAMLCCYCAVCVRTLLAVLCGIGADLAALARHLSLAVALAWCRFTRALPLRRSLFGNPTTIQPTTLKRPMNDVKLDSARKLFRLMRCVVAGWLARARARGRQRCANAPTAYFLFISVLCTRC
jgi:hypothetical protein